MEKEINSLNQIIRMFNINNDSLGISTTYFKGHILINLDFFRRVYEVYLFIGDRLLKENSKYVYSTAEHIYVYVVDVERWLAEFKLQNK